MKADYGIDAPTVVRNMAAVGAVCLAVGLAFPQGVALGAVRFASPTFLGPGVSFSIGALWMLVGSKVLKIRKGDRMLDSLGLAGDERMLDVGCGRGLLLIGAAKRTPHGWAVGIDIWQRVDQSGNEAAATLRNAEIEGVRDRIAVITGDMRRMPFVGAAFDVVVSCAAIHNIKSPAERAQAVREAARVLRPGGRFVIMDIGPVGEYVAVLKELGFQVSKSRPSFEFLIPGWTVRASKAADA